MLYIGVTRCTEAKVVMIDYSGGNFAQRFRPDSDAPHSDASVALYRQCGDLQWAEFVIRPLVLGAGQPCQYTCSPPDAVRPTCRAARIGIPCPTGSFSPLSGNLGGSPPELLVESQFLEATLPTLRSDCTLAETYVVSSRPD